MEPENLTVEPSVDLLPAAPTQLPPIYDIITRTSTFLVTYLIYLLIMFIVLDFWDKLKQPTKQFLRDKMVKYVGAETLAEYFELLAEGPSKTDMQVVDKEETAGGQVVDRDEGPDSGVRFRPGSQSEEVESEDLQDHTEDTLETELEDRQETDSDPALNEEVEMFVQDTIAKAVEKYQQESVHPKEE